MGDADEHVALHQLVGPHIDEIDRLPLRVVAADQQGFEAYRQLIHHRRAFLNQRVRWQSIGLPRVRPGGQRGSTRTPGGDCLHGEKLQAPVKPA
jgi:hypothetical protein